MLFVIKSTVLQWLIFSILQKYMYIEGVEFSMSFYRSLVEKTNILEVCLFKQIYHSNKNIFSFNINLLNLNSLYKTCFIYFLWNIYSKFFQQWQLRNKTDNPINRKRSTSQNCPCHVIPEIMKSSLFKQ